MFVFRVYKSQHGVAGAEYEPEGRRPTTDSNHVCNF